MHILRFKKNLTNKDFISNNEVKLYRDLKKQDFVKALQILKIKFLLHVKNLLDFFNMRKPFWLWHIFITS